MSLLFNIAIDGHSSCGKSTIARNIARKYGMCYVDTGAMYRAVTLYFMRRGVIKDQRLYTRDLLSFIDDISINFEFNLNFETNFFDLELLLTIFSCFEFRIPLPGENIDIASKIFVLPAPFSPNKTTLLLFESIIRLLCDLKLWIDIFFIIPLEYM